MKTTYKTSGTCATRIDIDIEDGVIRSADFHGGCDGNLAGISKLVAGMEASRARELLRGIKCGRKSTSCPDQLAKAIDEAISKG
jgi:uncharacterized protein (TIGR03905 family)